MNTEHDEAYKLLHHVLSAANPWKSKYRRSADLVRNIVSNGLRIAKESDKVLFSRPSTNILSFCLWLLPVAPILFPSIWALMLLVGILSLVITIRPLSLVTALMLPVRLFRGVAAFWHSVFSALLSIAFPIWGWRWFQLRTLGLAGSPYDPTEITISFKPSGSGDYRFEELTKPALDGAVRNRRTGIKSTSLAVSNFLETKDWTLVEFQGLFQRIMSDIDLVHSAYFRSPDCVDRIAAWVSRTEQDRKSEAAEVLRHRAWRVFQDLFGGFGI